MEKPVKIKDLEELKNFAEKDVEVFIQLNYGLRSYKGISYDRKSDKWSIFNYIDDTEQNINTEELPVCTNLIKALKSGALFIS